MMENEFIPYKEALDLKAFGFDEDCLGAYVDEELDIGGLWRDSVKSKVIHKAPLYQQAFRWFRDVHDLDFTVINIRHKTYEEAELACLRKLIDLVNQNKDE